MRTIAEPLFIGLLTAAVAGSGQSFTTYEPETGTAQAIRQPLASLEREVRQQLVTLPFYSVFDNLEFKVDGDRVELFGQTVNPPLKTDAETMVKKIEGVDSVVDNIEVLPPSPQDDRIRLAEFRAIYGDIVL